MPDENPYCIGKTRGRLSRDGSFPLVPMGRTDPMNEMTPERKLREGSHLPGGYRTPHVPTSVALRAVDDARAEERKRIIDLLRDGAMRREIRSNRPGNAAATTLMASWEALRLAADVIERSAGSAGSDGEDR